MHEYPLMIGKLTLFGQYIPISQNIKIESGDKIDLKVETKLTIVKKKKILSYQIRIIKSNKEVFYYYSKIGKLIAE